MGTLTNEYYIKAFMKFSKGIQNFWFVIGEFIFNGLVVLLAVFWFSGWNFSKLLSFPSVIGVIISFSLIVFPLIWFLPYLKSQMLQAMPDEWQFKVGVIADYPQLDLAWLQQQTNDLESLGFVQLMDCKVEVGTGFTRCFAHPQQYCFAEIGQYWPETGEKNIYHCTIFSLLDRDWAIGEINREVNQNDGIAYIWRHPKHIRTYHPNINLDNFFQLHLRLRQQVITDLGITLLTDVSWTEFRNFLQQMTVFQKQTFSRKPLLLAMLEATFFEMNPKSQWLGDYPKEAAKRRANRR
jgi:hypothetical protein